MHKEITLTQRQLCDLELILNGGFSPLKGFMHQTDYNQVLEKMRLAEGSVWPIPITLDVDHTFGETIAIGETIELRDEEGLLLAFLKVEECWEIDKQKEALAVFGTNDSDHPGVSYLNQQVKDVYLGGEVTPVSSVHHYDFTHLRHSPHDLRELFKQLGWEKVVAFQTRNPMHRAHQELTLRAVNTLGAKLLIHPVVGMTKPGDIDYYIRVRCYEHILKTYPANLAILSLLPLAMRMAGPREALWHAIIRKNFGCTHFIVGRDHAGPGKNSKGEYFYDAYAAQQLALQYQNEIGIQIVPFQEMVFSHKKAQYYPIEQFPQDEAPATISGSELRERLAKNLDIPGWFSYPAVMQELRKAYPPKYQQGFTIFFSGLPCSGKSTLANGLLLKLRELTDRQITLLDGDIIRNYLSKGLGFSKVDRETNISRVGFVAKEITKHNGIAICALVAPYQKAREAVRQFITEVGGFIEVHVETPLSICEQRDRKGFYKKARLGVLQNFTGISDPYEEPLSPEITIDTSNVNPSKSIDDLIEHIRALGYIQ